jgi:hypothetical protein
MPDIELTLQEARESDLLLLTLGMMSNIQAGIKVYGSDVTAIVDIQAGISGGAAVPIQVEIPAPTIQAPTNPLALHLGQGVVMFSWGHPAPERVDHYEVYASTSELGTYEKYPGAEFVPRRGRIFGVPVGSTAFFQMCAIGFNGAQSSFVQVKLGKLEPLTIAMKVRAIQGSQIKDQAIFTALDQQTGDVIAIRAPNTILIQ